MSTHRGMRPRCAHHGCHARRIAYRLCHRHWTELCTRAGAERTDRARVTEENR